MTEFTANATRGSTWTALFVEVCLFASGASQHRCAE